MKKCSANFTFYIDKNQYGISIEVDPDAPGGGSIAIYSMGTGPMGDIGTSLTLKEWENQPLPGPAIPPPVLQQIHEFLFGSVAPKGEAAPIAVPDGDALKRFSWEEGYDWEFYYYIDIYHNGVLFTASGEEQRGITPRSEFQAFDRAGGILYPSFMSTGGSFFLFESWLKEYNELDRQTR